MATEEKQPKSKFEFPPLEDAEDNYLEVNAVEVKLDHEKDKPRIALRVVATLARHEAETFWREVLAMNERASGAELVSTAMSSLKTGNQMAVDAKFENHKVTFYNAVSPEMPAELTLAPCNLDMFWIKGDSGAVQCGFRIVGLTAYSDTPWRMQGKEHRIVIGARQTDFIEDAA